MFLAVKKECAIYRRKEICPVQYAITKVHYEIVQEISSVLTDSGVQIYYAEKRYNMWCNRQPLGDCGEGIKRAKDLENVFDDAPGRRIRHIRGK